MSTQYQPRYPESNTYDSLTDLLSDGFPEDTRVDVYPDSGPIYASTISQLRAETKPFAKLHRVVAVANESYAERMPSGAVQYAVALITEDEPGWTAGGWWSSLEDAKDSADSFNRVARHTSDEVLDVQASSMRASRTR